MAAFFTDYNKLVSPEFAQTKNGLEFRLGVFGGIDNTIFMRNTDNSIHGVAGIDFELADLNLKRHALLFQFKQTFKTDTYDYSATQLAFNYRFKFVTIPKFDAFVNFKFAMISYWKETFEIPSINDPQARPEPYEHSGFGVGAPLSFGVGADYKAGNGFITFGFNDFVALNAASNKNFPIHFTLGYKWIL